VVGHVNPNQILQDQVVQPPLGTEDTEVAIGGDGPRFVIGDKGGDGAPDEGGGGVPAATAAVTIGRFKLERVVGQREQGQDANCSYEKSPHE